MSYQQRFQIPLSVASSPAAVPGIKQPRPVWLAALTLFVLAPFCGEVLSTSTPPTQYFFNPGNALFQPALYGSGALLVRELARRRGLAWSNLLMLGAAYGILEEGVVTNTWFNPLAGVGSLGIYGHALGVNWLWALELTAFHAVVSIAIPIVLVDALFPSVAARPWLRAGGSCLFAALLFSASLVGAILWGFVLYARKGYPHPPAAYLLAILLMIAVFTLGLRRRWPPPAPARRAPPSLWRLRILGFAATLVFFGIWWLLPALTLPAIVPAALFLLLSAALGVALRRWSTVPYWGAPQRLALATGVLTFFMLFAPLRESTAHPVDSLLLLALDLALVFILIRLAREATVVVELPGSMALPGSL